MNEILIYSLIVLGTLLALFLLVPIHFDGSFEYAGHLNITGRIRWASGLICFEINRHQEMLCWRLRVLGFRKSGPVRNAGEERGLLEKTSSKKRQSGSPGKIMSYVNRQLLAEIKTVSLKLMRALHLDLNLSGRYGFDDSSLTGYAAAVMAALNSGSSVNLVPDFSREVLDVRGNLKGWLIPMRIIGIALSFLLKKPVRAIWWPMIKFRKKQKEVFKYA